MDCGCCIPYKIFPRNKSYQIVPGLHADGDLPALPQHKSRSLFSNIVSLSPSRNNMQCEIEALEATARQILHQKIAEQTAKEGLVEKSIKEGLAEQTAKEGLAEQTAKEGLAEQTAKEWLVEKSIKAGPTVKFNRIPNIIPFTQPISSKHDIVRNG